MTPVILLSHIFQSQSGIAVRSSQRQHKQMSVKGRSAKFKSASAFYGQRIRNNVGSPGKSHHAGLKTGQ